MKKIELEIVALSHSITQSDSYAVVLGEKSGIRRLPVVIGAFEAQSIVVAIENVKPTRPLTHDLMKNLLDELGVTLEEIIVSDLTDGVFYARLVCDRNGETIEIDSRTSDALALAVRFKCPIFTYAFIMDQAGIVLESNEGETVDEGLNKPADLSSLQEEDSLNPYTNEELQEMMAKAAEQEDYQLAAKIRDELNRREKGN